MKNNKGFSLVELIVVIAIMAILAAVAIPTFAGFITKANQAADEGFANDVEYAVELALAAENVELESVTVVMDNETKKVETVSYKLKNDNTVYSVMGTTAGSTPADSDIAEMITGTIDKGYALKTALKNAESIKSESNVVTVTLEQ